MGHYDQFSESSFTVDFLVLVLIVRVVIVLLLTVFLLNLVVILVLFLVMFVLVVLIGGLVVFSFLFVQAHSLICLLLFFNKTVARYSSPPTCCRDAGVARFLWGLRLGK